jgi:hypothetical protein
LGFSPIEANIPQHPLIQVQQGTPPTASLPEAQRLTATG